MNSVTNSAPVLAELDSLLLREKAGDFAYSRLEREDLTQLATLIFNGEELPLRDVERIAREISLPMLAKLVQIQRLGRAFQSAKRLEVRIRPVCFLPLASLLEEGGKEFALDLCTSYLRELDKNLTLAQDILMAVDRWHGLFATDDFLSSLFSLSHLDGARNRFAILGPSTFELDQIAEMHSLSELLTRLRLAGVTTIEGGSDLELHEFSVRRGFAVAVGQQLANNNGSWDRFWREVLHLRTRLVPSGALQVWFPWSSTPLDRSENSAESPLGEQTLRAVALGRLVLPEVPYIRSPLSLMGCKVSHVALEFGANDLGFGAVDSRTAERLQIERLSTVTNLVREHAPFSRIVI